MKIIHCLVVFLLIGATAGAQSYVGDQADIDRILIRSAEWSEHYVEGDLRALSMLYTEDGMILPGGAPIIRGRDAIAERFQLKEGSAVIYHKVTPEEITITGDVAYDIGYYEGATTNSKDERSPFKGKYIIIWKKLDGEWFIYADIWNSMPKEE